MHMSINMSFTILAKNNEPEKHLVASPGTLEQLTSDQHHLLKTDIIHITGIDDITYRLTRPADSISINGEIKVVEHGFEVIKARLNVSQSSQETQTTA